MHRVNMDPLIGCASTRCPRCQDEYHTFDRLRIHLDHHLTCFNYAARHAEKLDDEMRETQRLARIKQRHDLKALGYSASRAIIPYVPSNLPIDDDMPLAQAFDYTPREKPTSVQVHVPGYPRNFMETNKPRPFPTTNYRFFLHLFSGRRRPNDLQASVERRFKNMPIVVISVDLGNGYQHDLSKPDTIHFFMQLMVMGRVIF